MWLRHPNRAHASSPYSPESRWPSEAAWIQAKYASVPSEVLAASEAATHSSLIPTPRSKLARISGHGLCVSCGRLERSEVGQRARVGGSERLRVARDLGVLVRRREKARFLHRRTLRVRIGADRVRLRTELAPGHAPAGARSEECDSRRHRANLPLHLSLPSVLGVTDAAGSPPAVGDRLRTAARDLRSGKERGREADKDAAIHRDRDLLASSGKGGVPNSWTGGGDRTGTLASARSPQATGLAQPPAPAQGRGGLGRAPDRRALERGACRRPRQKASRFTSPSCARFSAAACSRRAHGATCSRLPTSSSTRSGSNDSSSAGESFLPRAIHRARRRLSHDALGLWRGPPLDDVRYEDFAQPEIARLEELRQGVLEERAAAELALGRHAELLPDLEALVRQYPLRERLRAQLMQALYQSGRQTEALAVYEDGRRALDEEFGLEPSRELQDLQRAILTQDPQLDAPPRKGPAADGRARRKLITIVGACLLASRRRGGRDRADPRWCR